MQREAEMGVAILTKTSTGGKQVVVSLDGGRVTATVDGVAVAGEGEPVKLGKSAVKGDITHYLPTKPAIGLTAAEAATISAAAAGERETARLARVAAAGPVAGLREQRRELLTALTAAQWAQDEAAERAHATGDARNVAAEHQPAVTAAEQALAAFDVAHPEVLATIRAERAAEAARLNALG